MRRGIPAHRFDYKGIISYMDVLRVVRDLWG